MAETGETYQQAQIALAKLSPVQSSIPQESDRPCVGRCESEYLSADRQGRDGGSMIACAHCPGAVCVECGTAAVEEPFARCEQCASVIERWERAERLRSRCAGRRCISKSRAGTADSDSADHICDSCDGPICWCGYSPVEDWWGWCDHGCLDDKRSDEWSDQQERHDLQQQFEYAAGLIVKLGGGTRRQVFAQLHKIMKAKLPDASIEQLMTAVEHARDWERRLRAKPDPESR